MSRLTVLDAESILAVLPSTSPGRTPDSVARELHLPVADVLEVLEIQWRRGHAVRVLGRYYALRMSFVRSTGKRELAENLIELRRKIAEEVLA